MSNPGLSKEACRPGRRRLQQVGVAALLGCVLGVAGSFAFYLGFIVRDQTEYGRQTLRSVDAKSRPDHQPCQNQEVRSSVLAEEWRLRADELMTHPAGVRLVPTIRNGEPIGFKIYAIEEGSLPALVGLRNGDTLTAIQGLPLRDTGLALDMLGRLRGGDTDIITLDGERRGCPLKFIVTIEA